MARDRASRPEARPLRLFVAVDVPDDVREHLAAVVDPWRARFPTGRWVPSQNWHVTLKFMGSTWPRLLGWVEERVARVAAAEAPFQTRLESLGAFASGRRARVLWAGLSDVGARFAGLAQEVESALAEHFRPENRAFTPHLTVARFDPPMDLSDALAETDVASDPFRVDRLVLYRSHLQRPAPRYEPLSQFDLGGTAGG